MPAFSEIPKPRSLKKIFLGLGLANLIQVLVPLIFVGIMFVWSIFQNDMGYEVSNEKTGFHYQHQTFEGWFFSVFVFLIKFFGFFQLFLIFPLAYFFQKRNKLDLGRGLKIGALIALLINIICFIYGYGSFGAKGTRVFEQVDSSDGLFDAYIVEDYEQRQPVITKYPPEVLSYRVYLDWKNIYDLKRGACFEADDVTPSRSVKINWRTPEILEVHYQEANILKYHPNWLITAKDHPNKLIKIELIKDKPGKS